MNLLRYTLFAIEPTITAKEELPSVPQRCTRGHSWDIGVDFVGLRLDMSTFGITAGAEEYCFFCFRDWLKEHCGRVVR